MNKYIWKLEEICELSWSGNWFYGLIWDEKRLRFGEIFLGIGYTAWTWPRDPKSFYWAITDILRAKKKYLKYLEKGVDEND